ncbi:hypothetical protein [Clostridium sp.]|uniref:hypothetical protein n=1 Tax=Clostridium sp. TaxID=1506 RepID=UPI002FCBC75C
MEYYLSFSWIGFIVFLLPMIPNIFYFVIPTPAGSENKGNTHGILDVIEHGSQGIFIFLLIFVVRKQTSEVLCAYTIIMAITLISYYVLWGFFILGKADLILLLGLTVLPVVYFIFAEIWLHNYLAIIPTVIFGIAHIIVTYKNSNFKH